MSWRGSSSRPESLAIDQATTSAEVMPIRRAIAAAVGLTVLVLSLGLLFRGIARPVTLRADQWFHHTAALNLVVILSNHPMLAGDIQTA